MKKNFEDVLLQALIALNLDGFVITDKPHIVTPGCAQVSTTYTLKRPRGVDTNHYCTFVISRTRVAVLVGGGYVVYDGKSLTDAIAAVKTGVKPFTKGGR